MPPPGAAGRNARSSAAAHSPFPPAPGAQHSAAQPFDPNPFASASSVFSGAGVGGSSGAGEAEVFGSHRAFAATSRRSTGGPAPAGAAAAVAGAIFGKNDGTHARDGNGAPAEAQTAADATAAADLRLAPPRKLQTDNSWMRKIEKSAPPKKELEDQNEKSYPGVSPGLAAAKENGGVQGRVFKIKANARYPKGQRPSPAPPPFPAPALSASLPLPCPSVSSPPDPSSACPPAAFSAPVSDARFFPPSAASRSAPRPGVGCSDDGASSPPERALLDVRRRLLFLAAARRPSPPMMPSATERLSAPWSGSTSTCPQHFLAFFSLL